MEVLTGNAVEPAQVSLGLVPEVFDAVDVRTLADETLLVVDTPMLESGDVEHIVDRETISKNNGIRLDALLYDGQQGLAAGVGDDQRVDLASALEQAEHRHLSRGAAASFALASTAEITLVDLHLSGQQMRCLGVQTGGDELSQLVEEQRRGMPVDPDHRSRRTSR